MLLKSKELGLHIGGMAWTRKREGEIRKSLGSWQDNEEDLSSQDKIYPLEETAKCV